LPYLKFHLRRNKSYYYEHNCTVCASNTTWKQKLKDITDLTLNIHIKIYLKFINSFRRRLERHHSY
jgi:hypothetical protein